VLLKKGWHHQPWERRGTIYQQQLVFTSALVIAYARPFTRANGWPRFPAELMAFNEKEKVLHEKMLELRHSVFAHSDSKHYKVTPWRAQEFSTDILSAPWPRITKEDAVLLQRMIAKLQTAIQRRCEEMCSQRTASD
jgi:hypothetical protein